MNARERFVSTMERGKPDHLPLCEFMGYWPETLERWRGEGLPEGVDLPGYFGCDRYEAVPLNFNFVPPFDRVVLEEDGETRLVIDECGRKKREFKSGSAMPHHMDFPIKTRRDFLEVRDRLDPHSPGRYPANWPELVETYRRRDYPLGLRIRSLFAFGRDFMSFTDLMVAFHDEPEFIQEMMDWQTEFIIGLWEKALSEVAIDFVLLGEDMAYKGGPMISPALVSEIMVPRYRRITGFVSQFGVRVSLVDSDGDIRRLVPLFLEGGITGVLPVENAAGCDPRDLRAIFGPGLQMVGGLDKRRLCAGRDAIVQEVRDKLGALRGAGAYIPGFDHSVPPGISLDDYRFYLEVLRGCC